MHNPPKINQHKKKNGKGAGMKWIIAGMALVVFAAVFFLRNLTEEARAREHVRQVLEELRLILNNGEAPLADYLIVPEMEMPHVTLHGQDYIGVLEIPGQGLQLPVTEHWSTESLRSAPGRYAGTVYRRNMVICGLNYPSQFGKLTSLPIGEELLFTDLDRNRFVYTVESVEQLRAASVSAMKNSSYDLTLFTTASDGSMRFAVRCRLTQTQ